MDGRHWRFRVALAGFAVWLAILVSLVVVASRKPPPPATQRAQR